MLSILYGSLSDDFREGFPIIFCLLEEEYDEIEEEGDARIDEYICSISNPEYLPDEIYSIWNKCKEKESSTNGKKYEKMKCIKTLSSRYIISRKGYNKSRYNEKNL